MKKKKLVYLFTLTIFFISAFQNINAKSLNIVTTTSTLEAVVKEITSVDQVSSLVKGSQDAHYIQAKPSYIAKLRKADLLVSIGLGLEDAWLSKVIQSSRNLNIMPGKKGSLVAGQLVNAIEIPQGTVTRSMGDVHPEGNPHILLDPVRVIDVAQGIVKSLSALRPDQKNIYQDNFVKFKDRVNKAINIWNTKLSKLKQRKVISYHSTLNYFLQRFKLEQAASIEPKPGIPPTAKHIQQLIAKIKQEKISCIMMESIFDDAPAKSIAKKSNIRMVKVAPELGGLKNNQTYLSWMNDIVVSAIQCLQ